MTRASSMMPSNLDKVKGRAFPSLFAQNHNMAVLLYYPESCEHPIPGGAQGQVGWGPGQSDLVGGSHAKDTGLELSGL